MKHAAQNHCDRNNKNKDKGMSDWIAISTPDDLFKLNIDEDLTKFNYKLLLFNNDLNFLLQFYIICLCFDVLRTVYILIQKGYISLNSMHDLKG